MADDEEKIYEKKKSGCLYSCAECIVRLFFRDKPKKMSAFERDLSKQQKETKDGYVSFYGDEAILTEATSGDDGKLASDALLVMCSNDEFNIAMVGPSEQERKTMSHSRFFKGFLTGAATTTVASGAIGYGTGIITIKSATILFAGSVGLAAIAPWLAALSFIVCVAALVSYCYSNRRVKKNNLGSLLLEDWDMDEDTSRSPPFSPASHGFFKGFSVGVVTTAAAGSAIGYATGVIAIKNATILFAGSVSLTSIAPWIVLGLLGIMALYRCYSRRQNQIILLDPVTMPKAVFPDSFDRTAREETWILSDTSDPPSKRKPSFCPCLGGGRRG